MFIKNLELFKKESVDENKDHDFLFGTSEMDLYSRSNSCSYTSTPSSAWVIETETSVEGQHLSCSSLLPAWRTAEREEAGKDLDSIAAGEEIGREREEVMLARIDD